jgi:Protein of unknown function (DUF938)
MKRHSDACERNREPILQVLKQWFRLPGQVLEIGAGTGQHAVYFAEHLPHLTWLASDREENLEGIRAWTLEALLPNAPDPVRLDVRSPVWPVSGIQYVFSANTAHIMSWPEVEAMFAGVSRSLRERGVFCLYGPFNRDGKFTSDSNREFDESLRARDPNMGIRDDQALIALGRKNALTFTADCSMPARNRLLIWTRDPSASAPATSVEETPRRD